MTKKVIANPYAKDSTGSKNRPSSTRSSSRIGSRMSTRAFDKQTNESNPRLNHVSSQEDVLPRPHSGSSQRSSYKDAAMAENSSGKNKFQALQVDTEDSSQVSTEGHHSLKEQQQKPQPLVEQQQQSATEQDQNSNNNDDTDDSETQWTTVQHSKKKPSSTDTVQKKEGELKDPCPAPTKEDLDIEDENHTTYQDIRREIREELQEEMKKGFDNLINLFEQHIRPASIISVRTSNRTSTKSDDTVESLTSKVIHTKTKIPKKHNEMNKQVHDQTKKDQNQDKVELQPPPVRTQLQCYEAIPMDMNPANKGNSTIESQHITSHPCQQPPAHKPTSVTTKIPIDYYNQRDREILRSKVVKDEQEHHNGTLRHEDDDNSEKRRIPRNKVVKDEREHHNGTLRYEDDDNSEKRHENRKRQAHRYRSKGYTNHFKNDSDSESEHNDKMLFGQNEFSLACNNNIKIKYSDMNTFLKDKKLQSDAIVHLEKLYSNLSRSLSFAFQSHIGIMPKFRQLTPTISFEELFLDGLIGATLSRCRAIFDRLGEIIKDILTSSTCIDKLACPKTERIVDTNIHCDGWQLLEQILRKRVVFCGALPDIDLDVVLAHHTFKENESRQQFYSRTKSLINQYKVQYRHDASIPFHKIVMRFTRELMRASEYAPYIAHQYRSLIRHQREYDRENMYEIEDFIPYTVDQIHEILDEIDAPERPVRLQKSTLQQHNEMVREANKHSEQHKDTSLRDIIASIEAEPDMQPIVASFQSAAPPLECETPSICVMRQPKTRCHACLLGFHTEVNCYLRGQSFMPEELRQRINRYNATHGTAPPKDHTPPIYKPASVSARLPNRNTTSLDNKNNTNNKNRAKRVPFSNNKTKQPSINSVDVEEESNDIMIEEDNEGAAVMNAFIASQVREVEENGEFYISNNDDDDDDPVICVVQSSLQHVDNAQTRNEKLQWARNADFDTPQQLLDVISEFHRRNKNTPNQHFLKQHADKLSRLPHDIYNKQSREVFQVDSGANVGAVNDRAMFYFFIPTSVSIEQAGGATFESKGWGGVLVEIGGRVRLHAPVHYCPAAPRNIFSPGAMISYSGFRKSSHDLHVGLNTIDNLGYQTHTPVTKKNGLNFSEFNIMCFDRNYYDMTRSVPVMAPARVYDAPLDPTISLQQYIQEKEEKDEDPDNSDIILSNSIGNNVTKNAVDTTNNQSNMVDKQMDDTAGNMSGQVIKLANGKMKVKDRLQMPVLGTSEISRIAAYYVHLFPAASPRSEAITTMNKVLGDVYTHLPLGLPAIFTDQPIINIMEIQDNEYTMKPILGSKLARKSSRTITSLQKYILLHIGVMHASDSTILPMIKRKLLKDMPNIEKDLGHYNCTCTFCVLTKSLKLPRGRLTDYSKMRPFQQLHMDFAIYNYSSIRGMTNALGVVCAATSYPFGFPTKSKNPPLENVRYLVQTLRSMGHVVNFIRVDEDGALARSAEFCRLVVQLNCVLQTTSGGNSENNGKVERPHQTHANMVRAALATMNIIASEEMAKSKRQVEDFWCFAYAHSVHIQRRLYSKGPDEVPYFLVHAKRPSAKELIPFGSIITVVNQNKEKLPKLSMERAAKCYFLGFGNHIRSILYWDPKHPATYKRAYHAIVEDSITLAALQDSFSSPLPDVVMDERITRTLHFNDSPFPRKDIRSISIPLPELGKSIGLVIVDDDLYNIPYIKSTTPHSVAYDTLPTNLRRNHFIISINGNSPITAKFVREHIKQLQKDGIKNLELDLVHRGIGDTSTSLEITRAIFDQLPALNNNRPIINSINSQVPSTHHHFIRSPKKPQAPRFFHECLRSPFRSNWIAAAKIAFEKNQRIAVFSLPFPRKELNSNQNVFSTVLVPEVKQTDIAGVWELRIRECIVGTKQQKSVDFIDSYSPTVNDTTVKLQIAFCASLDYTISIIDVKNAFQNTISKEEKRIFVTVPPTYMEWVEEFEDNFSYVKGESYIRQMLNANQGTRDAGNQWYALLYSVLQRFGLIRSTVDHGLFVKDYDTRGKLYVSLATDDLLCGYKCRLIFDEFVKFLRKYFVIVVQSGNVLKFLGIRIIQSKEAISIDQAQYIFSICESYFGEDPRQIRTVSIPMRSDGELERELMESPPLSTEELKEFALQYNGGFRNHIGKLNFAVYTRFDIQFAVQRLSEYSCEPTKAAFEGIDRVYRYLAQDILRPLIYPKQSLDGSTTMTVTLSPDQSSSLTFKHQPTLFTDAELGRDIQTRRSYYCIIVTVLGVVILCKIRKTSSVMLHTTDSEAQASYDGVRRLLPIRALCEFMGCPISEPTTHFVDNAAVHQIITSERMTPRCRHLDLPIAFLHEQFGKVFTSELIKTWLQLSDIGTKPLVRVTHKKFKYIGSGERYLPRKDSQHWKDLEMQFYEMKFQDIIAALRNE